MSATAAEAAAKQKLRFQARLSNPKEVWGIPYGIPKLDKLTGGIQLKEFLNGTKIGDNELITLIADTGVGKSSLAGMLARNVARYFADNHPDLEVRYVTLEMSGEKLQDRMVSSDQGIPLHRIKSGLFISDSQEERYYRGLDELAKLPIRYITADDVADMKALYKSVALPAEGKKCGFWIVDHLQICPGTSAENKNGAIDGAITYLVRLADKYAPGMVLAQMNKDALRRQDKRPQKSDIMYGSALIQASTLVFGLYREDVYTQIDIDNPPKEVPSELNILKSRDGVQACIYFTIYTDRMYWEVSKKKNGEAG